MPNQPKLSDRPWSQLSEQERTAWREAAETKGPKLFAGATVDAEAYRDTVVRTPMPITELSNGLLVGNLTSGHTFEFEDGSVLPACEADRVEAGKMKMTELKSVRRIRRSSEILVTYTGIELHPELSDACIEMLDAAEQQYFNDECHMAIVPLMMLEAIKKLRNRYPYKAYWEFAVVIRKNGRDVDGQRAKICIDRFCV